jgi:hypothetical protein
MPRSIERRGPLTPGPQAMGREQAQTAANASSQRGRYHTDRQPGAALQNTAICPARPPVRSWTAAACRDRACPARCAWPYCDGREDGYQDGHDDGETEGEAKGHAEGYAEGYAAGASSASGSG